MDLFYDYRTNPALYPKWQAFLRQHKPKTIILWSQGDIFFTPEGGESYLKDVPAMLALHVLSLMLQQPPLALQTSTIAGE